MLTRRESARDAVTAHDTDGDGALNFDEYCNMVRSLAPDTSLYITKRALRPYALLFSTSNLLQKFQLLDVNSTGKVTVEDVLHSSMLEALASMSTRAIDLFRKWDIDKSGSIDRKEFRDA